ncbi:MAG: hypothetical protein JWO79_806 [Actinomycetia bacterium]|nr:hypothetical protein [Actinomycetes bacterium]MDQ1653636.1 hypothetical protein [Cryptosporangiaceae bacterium]
MFAGQSYLWGPVMVLAVVGVLALVLRWIYGTARPVPPPRDDGDFGLLRELAIVRGQAEANALRAVLGDSGIRSTTAPSPGGTVVVMVFAADLDRARRAAGPR